MSRWWPRPTQSPGESFPDLPDIPGLELTVRGLADALMAGETASRFRGSGIEADSVRPYLAGDDVRAMDWRVTARTGRLHVRQWVEERGMEVHVVVDRSASLHEGVSPQPGRMALECAGAVAAAALTAGHRVGLLQVGDQLEARVPPEQSPGQLRRIAASLLSLRPRGRGTGLVAALRGVLATRGARSLVVVVSDFRVGDEEHPALGSVLFGLARRHDLLLLRVLVPGPEILPPVGVVSLRDPETGRVTVMDTSDPVVRQRLASVARLGEERLQELMMGAGVRTVDLDAMWPLGPQLQAGLLRRWGRVA